MRKELEGNFGALKCSPCVSVFFILLYSVVQSGHVLEPIKCLPLGLSVYLWPFPEGVLSRRVKVKDSSLLLHLIPPFFSDNLSEIRPSKQREDRIYI